MNFRSAIERSLKTPLAYWALLVYLLLAALFSQERLLNSDCSLQLFRSINDGSFFFQEGRYGMFITQIPMLVGVWLHLPMKAVICLYSLGLAGTYGACVLVAQRVFKSPAAALAIMLSLVVGVGDSFFHATTETHLLLAMSGLLFASIEWMAGCAGRARAYPVVGVITFWCLFTHPNALFTVGFVVLLAISSKYLRWWEGAGVLALCGIYFGLRLFFLPADSYDGQQFHSLLGSTGYLTGFWHLFPIWFIRRYLENEYAAVVVVLFLVMVFCRPLPKLLLVLGSASFFWFLTILTFHEGGGEAMMEKSFMPGTFMLCLPFTMLYHQRVGHGFFTVVVVLLFGHSYVNICFHRCYYSLRLATISAVIRDHGRETPKMLIPWSEVEGSVMHFAEWATSIDAMMLSRCMGIRPEPYSWTRE